MPNMPHYSSKFIKLFLGVIDTWGSIPKMLKDKEPVHTDGDKQYVEKVTFQH